MDSILSALKGTLCILTCISCVRDMYLDIRQDYGHRVAARLAFPIVLVSMMELISELIIEYGRQRMLDTLAAH
jgi:hypothetical protein